MFDVKSVEVGKESFLKLPDRIKYNHLIAEYYENLIEDGQTLDIPDDILKNKAERLRACSSIWDIDFYQFQRTKAIVRTNLCRDKFCFNCASALALARERKFAPVLDSISEKQNIYHCVFTVPNCKDTLLKTTVDAMYKAFSYFVRYFSQRAKIKGLSFLQYGYTGAVKSLEVTYNDQEDTYHPHLHCLFCLSPSLVLDKKYTNKFSYSKGSDEVRLFSEEEILFQKIWYLLFNGQLYKVQDPITKKLEVPSEFRVTKENIDKIDVGYSVIVNKAKRDDYKEVFKYAFKNNFDTDKVLGEKQFRVYREALRNVRFVQPYGELIKYDCLDEDLTNEELDIAFEEYLLQLEKVESPIRIYESYTEMLENMRKDKCFYITSGSIKNFLLDEEFKDNGESRLTEESKEILKKFREKIE